MHYDVHLYRQMRLLFEGIDAGSHEEAAAIAGQRSCDEADFIDDCHGEDFAALVDVVGDETYEQSRFIAFEAERLRQAAPKLLAALEEVTPLLDACARNAERLLQREFAAQLLTALSANRAAIAAAVETAAEQKHS